MNSERLRQIAILVDSLDTVQADRLLDQLPESTRQSVRQAVMELPQIDEVERQAIIQDFVSRKKAERSTAPMSSHSEAAPAMAGTYGDPRSMHRGTGNSAPSMESSSVPEYQKYLNRKSPSKDQASTVLEATYQPAQRTQSGNPSSEFRSPEPEGDLVDVLSQADIETLAAVVMKETPQVLAVVLSMLPADKSAQLLELFPDRQRQDALQRLANLDDVDEQVLDHLQQQLDRIVRRRLKLKRNQRSGPQALAAILSAARRLNSNDVVNSIHQQFQPGYQAETANHQTARSSVRPHEIRNTISEPTRTQPLNGNHENEDAAYPSVASQLLNRSTTQSSPQLNDNKMGHRVAHSPGTSTSPASLAKPATNDFPEQKASTAGNQRLEESADPEQRLASMEVNQVDAFADADIRFDFAKLAKCDRSSLEALLATAKPKLTLLALRGAPPKLLTRVLGLLPPNEAKEVEYRIQNLGATRLQDIQQAQQYLLRLASVLEDMGRFRSPRKSLLSF